MDENEFLNDLLECSVCFEQLDTTSKVLPCQHTFCRRCLHEIIATHKELRCPECRIKVDTKVDDLPGNILLIRLLDGLKNNPKTLIRHEVKSDTSSSSVASHSTGFQPQLPEETNKPMEVQSLIDVGLSKIPSIQGLNQNIDSKLYNMGAKGVRNFDNVESSDFKKEDVIPVRKSSDPAWFFYNILKSNNESQNSTSIDNCNNLVSGLPECKALYDFQAPNAEENECLRFKKGDNIVVIRRVDDNWAEGKLDQQVGIFPISFVELNEAAKNLIKIDRDLNKPNKKTPAIPSQTSFSPSSINGTNHPNRSKRYSLCIPLSPSNSIEHDNEHGDKSEKPDSGRNILRGSCRRETSLLDRALTYVAMYNYVPQKTDELELTKGEFYTVTEKCLDGWYKGTSIRTGAFGVFPGNYVQVTKTSVPQSRYQFKNFERAFINSNVMKPIIPPPPRPKSSTERNRTDSVTNGKVKSNVRPRPVANFNCLFTSTAILSPPSIKNTVSKLPTEVSTVSTLSNKSRKINECLGKHFLAASSTKPNTAEPKGEGLTEKSASADGTEKMDSLFDWYEMHGALTISPGKQANQNTMASSEENASPPWHKPKVVATRSVPEVLPQENASEKSKIQEKSKDKKSLLMIKWGRKHSKSPLSCDNPNFVDTSASSKGKVGNSSKGNSSVHTRSGSCPSMGPTLAMKVERHRCIEAYPPHTDQELELRLGDVVFVTKKQDDGWFRGYLQRNGKFGLFPGSFVESC